MGDAVESGFGELVKHARLERGWSQRELADLLRVDVSAVSRLEAGARAIRLAEAVTLAKALDIPLDSLAAPADPAANLAAQLDRAGARARQARTAVADAVGLYIEVGMALGEAPPAVLATLGLGHGTVWGYLQDRVAEIAADDAAASGPVPMRGADAQDLAEALIRNIANSGS